MKKIDPEQLFDEIRPLLERQDAKMLRRRLQDADAPDLAEIVEMLDEDEQQLFMAALNAEEAGEVLSMVDEATRGEIVDDMSRQELTGVVATMAPDDAADLLAELPDEQSEAVLGHLPTEQAAEVATLLQYEDDTAGGLMTPEFISVTQNTTVSDVVAELRKMDIADEEGPFYIYVVDEATRLLGLVPLHKLITVPPDTPVSAIMDPDLVTVSVDDDQEEVVNVIRRHDLPAVPVLDRAGRLVGRITHDDVADVIFEEADEDMLRMAGTDAAELERSSATRAARVRITWLLPCLAFAMCTGTVMFTFEGPVGKGNFLLLISFVPMIASMGGNCGMQASTIIIRGMATQEMAGQSLVLAFRRELPIALAVGAGCGSVGGLVATLVAWYRLTLGGVEAALSPVGVGLAVAIAMAVAIFVAASMGTLLPFLFRGLGIDPAIASGPLITTSNDIISVTIYFTVAMITISVLGP